MELVYSTSKFIFDKEHEYLESLSRTYKTEVEVSWLSK